jgi:hypothetical protein
MTSENPLIQVKFRIRQNVLRKLESEAERQDRSVNDEIGHRLEESFEYRRKIQRLTKEVQGLTDKLAAERERLAEERLQLMLSMGRDLATHPDPAHSLAAIRKDLQSHPDPKETKAAVGAMEESAERYIQEEIFKDEFLFPDRGKNARKRPPVAAVGSPPARKPVKL